MMATPDRSGSSARRQGRSASDPEALGSVLSRLFAARGYGRVQAATEMQTLWAEIAGERVAGETRVLGLKNGILTIGVNSTPLMSELAAFHRENLLAQLQARRGSSIRDLKFRRAPRSK